MKKENKMKKRLSLFIATVLAAGVVVPTMFNNINVAKAEAPSLKYYAAANQIEDLAIGTDKAARISFGRYNGKEATWYVVGKENAGSVILFSAQSFGTTEYQSDTLNSNKLISLGVNDGMYDPKDPDQDPDPSTPEYDFVYANHYGASTLRENLNGLINTCFKDIDSLMLPTTITLNDAYNGVDYKVSDRLYAPALSSDGSKLSFGGTKVIDSKIDFDSASFWTRTGSTSGKEDKAVTYSTTDNNGTIQETTDEASVGDRKDMRPAFALDVSSSENKLNVLFASAVPTTFNGGAQKIDPAKDNIMQLRMDGSNQEQKGADVAFNKGEISFKNAPSNSKIVVQGKYTDPITKDVTDWYWSSRPSSNKEGTISSSMTVTPAVEMGTGIKFGDTGIDFTECKIWMETTVGNLTYAVNGKQGIVEEIAITDIDPPVPGEDFDFSAKCETPGILESNLNIVWLNSSGQSVEGNKAEFASEYVASVTVTLAPGYKFTDAADGKVLTALVNGDTAEIKEDPNDSNIRTITYKFTTPADREIKYDILFDEKPIDEVLFNGSLDYDGQIHSVRVSITAPSGVYIGRQYKVEGGEWDSYPPEIKKAGSYKIDYKIDAGDDYDTVDSTKDPKKWPPITIYVKPRVIKIHPLDQEILWGHEISQNAYDITSGSDSLLPGDEIKGIILSPSEGTIINSDGIVSEGYIYFFPKDEDSGENLIKIVHKEDGKDDEDVTENYDVAMDNPGKLTILHNPNLPPKSITVDKAKADYYVGEPLMVNDLSVMASYADGFTQKVSGYTTNAEQIDMNTVGSKTLNVFYEENDGSADANLTIRVSEEPEDNNNGNNNGNNNNDGNNNGNNNNDGNGATGTNGSQNTGTANQGASSRAATNPTTGTSGTGTSTGTTSTTNGTNTKAGNNATVTGARTGDTNPIALWILAALSSGIVVVSLMLFNLGRGGKKRRTKR